MVRERAREAGAGGEGGGGRDEKEEEGKGKGEGEGEGADIVGDDAVHPHLHGAHAPAIRSIQRCFTVYITVLLCTSLRV